MLNFFFAKRCTSTDNNNKLSLNLQRIHRMPCQRLNLLKRLQKTLPELKLMLFLTPAFACLKQVVNSICILLNIMFSFCIPRTKKVNVLFTKESLIHEKGCSVISIYTELFDDYYITTCLNFLLIMIEFHEASQVSNHNAFALIS